jgi:putative membrane protein (TIGR04086 family)
VIYLNLIIKYLKGLIIPLSTVIILSIILAILNLLGLRNNNIIILIIMSVTLFISGYLIGKKVNNKGYINGLILGILFISICFLLSLFFKVNYHFNIIIYYLILILCSTFGSMIGIQKNK